MRLILHSLNKNYRRAEAFTLGRGVATGLDIWQCIHLNGLGIQPYEGNYGKDLQFLNIAGFPL